LEGSIEESGGRQGAGENGLDGFVWKIKGSVCGRLLVPKNWRREEIFALGWMGKRTFVAVGKVTVADLRGG
jgi:hypothetical protein